MVQYIFHHGQKSFASLSSQAPLLRLLAYAQDFIGWDHFMEGKISVEFPVVLQCDHLLTAPSILTVSDWTTAFITHLLHLTHRQWNYRNISKHHQRYGQLKNLQRTTLLREIDKYRNTAPEEVPEESRFLLEIDFQKLRSGPVDGQSYWVGAIQAAVTAGRRRSAWREHSHRGVSSPLVFSPPSSLWRQ